ncbi:gliding motility-associated C-terminal domain-containing protein [Parapedobacter sp. 10938]|uniref:gliding motility-associated C-terminal domain-containing protein n=1 Tax=Parapedobacter flavus TaxID=3110225 RepID=UPI002DB74AF4|nr:gliding motility-associated C-terminal domain-containing protein [Parapedobacter sp. 10938]MEC3880579.1 gliding motility-associated C-terminal domain-containing protein [Parapedobacter sp. 10938]
MPNNRLVIGGALLVAGLPGGAFGQQGCTNFGDPIIHITFGSAEAPITQLADEVTTYNLYQDDGFFMRPNHYTITANANTAGASVFHSFTDHTGDRGGGMLLVNADYEPDIFYTETQSGLCQNTDFTFSAWIANASPPNLNCGGNNTQWNPNVQFEIWTTTGELIISKPTGQIRSGSNAEWLPFSLSFNTGDHTDVVLIMRNIGPGGCGNNLAIDDIQFRPCGPELQLLPSIVVTQDNTIFLCEDANEVTFQGQVGAGYGTPAYQWQEREDVEEGWRDIRDARQASLTVSPAQGTSYRLTVAANEVSLGNQKCRVVSDAFRVTPAEVPTTLPAVEHVQLCVGDNRLLSPEDAQLPDSGPLTYQWYEWRNGDWRMLADGATDSYAPPIGGVGNYGFQRRATNVCGVSFPVNTYQLEIVSLTETSFDLPAAVFCLNSPEVRLTGGFPAAFGTSGEAGVYSGPGVENGVFYPSLAGVGEHPITYSPPNGVACPVPSTAMITVREAVYVEPMVDHVVLAGQRIRLIPKTNGSHFTWDSAYPGLSSYTDPAPFAAPESTTTYHLTVRDEAGCTDFTSVTVRVLPPLRIPNSFTPNGDGVNDTWVIDGLADYPNTIVHVFNRWGVVVHTFKGSATPWTGFTNGRSLPAAVYYYTLSSDALPKPLSGTITILR